MLRSPLPIARVTRRHELSADLMILQLRPAVPFAFTPGQYATLSRGGVERPYSIVSAPHQRELELFIERVADGILTPRLWDVQPGDTVHLRPRAKGVFTMERGVSQHVMVATVTGIAPFVSIIRDYLHRGGWGHRFVVLHGASFADELAYCRELSGVAAARPDVVRYVPTVSRPADSRNAAWCGAVGRVNTAAMQLLESLQPTLAHTVVYLCGHPGMIAELAAWCAERGLRSKQERFWKESIVDSGFVETPRPKR